MSSIFSTQNLQTFLRRKNFRPPGPPPSRPAPPGPRPPPPNLGRSPPGLPPSLRGLSLAAACSGAFVSSAITLHSVAVINNQRPEKIFLFEMTSHGPPALTRSPEFPLPELPQPLLGPQPPAARSLFSSSRAAS